MPPNLTLFLGRLHPLFVHLPIGFLTLLTIVELARRHRWFAASAHARGVIVIVTAASAVASVLLGLMLSSDGGYDPQLLWWHKWMGILLAIGTIAAGIAFYASRPRWYAGFLVCTLALLGPASHLGGSMTHGKNYLFAYAPMWMRPPAEMVIPAAPTTQRARTIKDAILFTDLVQPILNQNCIACHNADKTSGQLRLDTFTDLTRGGHSGPAVVAGDPGNSLIFQRISSPILDAHHMPPDGKPQLTDDQVTLLVWWIRSGADEHSKTGDTQPTGEQIAVASRLLNLPVPGEAPSVPPVPLADLQALINAAVAQTNVVMSAQTVDQPWLLVNASLNKSFGDAELTQLGPLAPNIVDLNLAGTHVTDAGLLMVGAMPNLHRLRLDRTAITDAGLAHLAGLSKLEYLNLYDTPITGAGLKTLAPLGNLRHIYVWKTQVDSAAAASFTAARTDKARTAEIEKQIEKLQQELTGQKIEVVEGVAPATRPASGPVTKPTTAAVTRP